VRGRLQGLQLAPDGPTSDRRRLRRKDCRDEVGGGLQARVEAVQGAHQVLQRDEVTVVVVRLGRDSV